MAFLDKLRTDSRAIFISYSSIDRGRVDGLGLIFEGLGKDVFHDHRVLKPGMKWKAGLQEGLDEADTLVLFWTKHAGSSDWVRWEYEHFLAKGARAADASDDPGEAPKSVSTHDPAGDDGGESGVEAQTVVPTEPKLIPVLVDDTPLPEPLSQFHAVDLSKLLGSPGKEGDADEITVAVIEKLQGQGIDLSAAGKGGDEAKKDPERAMFLLLGFGLLATLWRYPSEVFKRFWNGLMEKTGQISKGQALALLAAVGVGIAASGPVKSALADVPRGVSELAPEWVKGWDWPQFALTIPPLSWIVLPPEDEEERVQVLLAGLDHQLAALNFTLNEWNESRLKVDALAAMLGAPSDSVELVLARLVDDLARRQPVPPPDPTPTPDQIQQQLDVVNNRLGDLIQNQFTVESIADAVDLTTAEVERLLGQIAMELARRPGGGGDDPTPIEIVNNVDGPEGWPTISAESVAEALGVSAQEARGLLADIAADLAANPIVITPTTPAFPIRLTNQLGGISNQLGGIQADLDRMEDANSNRDEILVELGDLNARLDAVAALDQLATMNQILAQWADTRSLIESIGLMAGTDPERVEEILVQVEALLEEQRGGGDGVTVDLSPTLLALRRDHDRLHRRLDGVYTRLGVGAGTATVTARTSTTADVVRESETRVRQDLSQYRTDVSELLLDQRHTLSREHDELLLKTVAVNTLMEGLMGLRDPNLPDLRSTSSVSVELSPQIAAAITDQLEQRLDLYQTQANTRHTDLSVQLERIATRLERLERPANGGWTEVEFQDEPRSRGYRPPVAQWVPDPVYPPEAGGREGAVRVEALIDERGDVHVQDVHLVDGPAALAEEAERTINKWVYDPATVDGDPVSLRLRVSVVFTVR
jgi:hypothetical protein